MNLWMFKQKINDIDGTENITERFELFRVWVENTYVGYQKSWELEEQETMMNAISEKGFWGSQHVAGCDPLFILWVPFCRKMF